MPQRNERDPSRSPALTRGPDPSALRRPTRANVKNGSKAKALGPGFRRDDDRGSFFGFELEISALASAARKAALCSSRVPSRPRRGRAGKSPSGARAWMRARSLSGHGWPVSEPPERPRGVAGHDARRPRPRGCVLFGYFLLHKQEKVTPSQGCEGSSQGRESDFVMRPKVKRKNRWIPASTGMTKMERLSSERKKKDRDWIPAFAGMTK